MNIRKYEPSNVSRSKNSDEAPGFHTRFVKVVCVTKNTEVI